MKPNDSAIIAWRLASLLLVLPCAMPGQTAPATRNLADEEYIRTTTLYGSPRDFSLRMRYRF